VLLASSASKVYGVHGPLGVRGEAIVYGRYNEAFAVLLMAFALASWSQQDNGSKRQLWHTVAVVVIMGALTFILAAEIDDALVRHVADTPEVAPLERIPPSGVRANSVPGIYPLVVLFGGLEIVAISAVSVLAFVLIMGALRLSNRLGIALLIVAFGCIAVANHRLFLVPAKEKIKPRLRFVELISKLGPIDRLGYDTEYLEGSFFRGIQYLMRDTVFVRFDSRQGEVPETEAVISGRDWRLAETYGAKFFVWAPQVDKALWVMPGELQSGISLHAPRGELMEDQPAVGVRFGGFNRRTLNAGTLGRWTNGSAAIKVNVDPQNPPRMLGIDIAPLRRDDILFELRVNGVTLWDGSLHRQGIAATFDLQSVPIQDELTIAFIHRSIGGSVGVFPSAEHDEERGLFVRQVRLEGPASLGSAVVGGLTLGAEQVLGVPESGFHGPESFNSAPARWTNGAARMHILLDPGNLPSRLEVATAAPGRDSVPLRITANGFELWKGQIPGVPWSRSFDLSGIPLENELSLELASDTFRPTDSVEGSDDARNLGVMIRSIHLSTHARRLSTPAKGQMAPAF
jgi:hypothetical protein